MENENLVAVANATQKDVMNLLNTSSMSKVSKRLRIMDKRLCMRQSLTKRLIGRRFVDSATQKDMNNLTYKFFKAPNGDAWIKMKEKSAPLSQSRTSSRTRSGSCSVRPRPEQRT